MSGQDHNGRKPPSDDVRDMLRQLASQIKDQIADVDRRQNAAIQDMELRLKPGAATSVGRATTTTPPPTERAVAQGAPTVTTLGDDDPWDLASAEALTRLYEGDTPEAVAPASKVIAVAASGPKAVASIAKPTVQAQAIYFSDPPTAPSSKLVPTLSKPVMATVPAASTAASTDQLHKASAGTLPPSATLGLASSLGAVGPSAAPAAPIALTSLAADRAWLDSRLADLHRKVEDTLSGFDPSPIIKPLSNRIEQMEGQVIDVLGTLVQKADLERFVGLETDMATVKDHVEAARGQLKRLERLDGIEAQLRSLAAVAAEAQNLSPVAAIGDRAGSTDRLDDMEVMLRDLHAFATEQQTAAPQAQTDVPDFHGLAEKAAERAVQSMVEQHKDLFSPAKRAELFAQVQSKSQSQAGPSLEDMQALLDSYAQEQRHEASQTAASLTTMQEALIRLIDRIEELAADGTDQTAEVGQASTPQSYVEVVDERAGNPGRRAIDRQPQQTEPMPKPPAAPVARAPSTPHAATAETLSQPLPTKPAIANDAEAAAREMAAERARVAAERNQGRRAAMPRPQVQVAQETAETVAAPAEPVRVPRVAGKSSMSGQKKIMTLGLVGAALIGAAIVTYPMFGERMAGVAKMGDRIPRAETPRAVPPAGVIASEPPPAALPRPTPSMPEAQPNRDLRPQPAASQPLPQQPSPRDAPGPQTAPAGRAVDTPAAPARRPRPETATDDLTFNGQPPAEGATSPVAEAVGATVTTASMHGIALDNSGAMPDPTELARRQTRLAPVEVSTVQPPRVASEPTDNNADAISRTRPEMPPAQIGPMSLRIAAQQGDPSAAFEVGARFAEAKGVKQDFQQAITWFSRAAQQGFVPAQYRLATIYEGGLHGTVDAPRAKIWYKRAADQGHVKAMHNLAVLSAGSGQTQPDYQTAARWFSEAAERGLADSQFNLAVLHESGLGVAKDHIQAYKWFALAARGGDKEALRRRDALLASFSPQVSGSAEKLVQAWRSKPTDLKANDPRAAAVAWQNDQARLQEQALSLLAQQQQKRDAAVAAAQAAAPTPAADATSTNGATAPPTPKTIRVPASTVPRSTASIPAAR